MRPRSGSCVTGPSEACVGRPQGRRRVDVACRGACGFPGPGAGRAGRPAPQGPPAMLNEACLLELAGRIMAVSPPLRLGRRPWALCGGRAAESLSRRAPWHGAGQGARSSMARRPLGRVWPDGGKHGPPIAYSPPCSAPLLTRGRPDSQRDAAPPPRTRGPGRRGRRGPAGGSRESPGNGGLGIAPRARRRAMSPHDPQGGALVAGPARGDPAPGGRNACAPGLRPAAWPQRATCAGPGVPAPPGPACAPKTPATH